MYKVHADFCRANRAQNARSVETERRDITGLPGVHDAEGFRGTRMNNALNAIQPVYATVTMTRMRVRSYLLDKRCLVDECA